MPSGARDRHPLLTPGRAVRTPRRRRGVPSAPHVERGEARAAALGHDQRAPVVGEHVAVGRLQVVGGARHRAVGRDPDGLPRHALAAVVDADTHVAHVRGAVGGDDHVVERARGPVADRSACSTTVPSGSTRSSRCVSIATTSIRPSGSQPSPDGSSSVTSTTVPAAAPVPVGDLGAHDTVGVHVREHEGAVVPPRPLAEHEAVDDRARRCKHHGRMLAQRGADRRGARPGGTVDTRSTRGTGSRPTAWNGDEGAGGWRRPTATKRARPPTSRT